MVVVSPLLPDELLLTVFTFLDWRDLLAAESVCSAWVSLSARDMAWKTVSIKPQNLQRVQELGWKESCLQSVRPGKIKRLAVDWTVIILFVLNVADVLSGI